MPRKVSIIARGVALGKTWHVDEGVQMVLSKTVLINKMAALPSGRFAEELVFGEPGTGASDDLEQVGTFARMMVCQLGMSEQLGALPDGDESNGARHHSEQLARIIDGEVHRFVDLACQRARDVLSRSRSSMDRVADALLERESLLAIEIDRLAGPPPVLDSGVATGWAS